MVNHSNSVSLVDALTNRIVPEFVPPIAVGMVAVMMIGTIIASISFIRLMKGKQPYMVTFKANPAET